GEHTWPPVVYSTSVETTPVGCFGWIPLGSLRRKSRTAQRQATGFMVGRRYDNRVAILTCKIDGYLESFVIVDDLTSCRRGVVLVRRVIYAAALYHQKEPFLMATQQLDGLPGQSGKIRFTRFSIDDVGEMVRFEKRDHRRTVDRRKLVVVRDHPVAQFTRLIEQISAILTRASRGLGQIESASAAEQYINPLSNLLGGDILLHPPFRNMRRK